MNTDDPGSAFVREDIRAAKAAAKAARDKVRAQFAARGIEAFLDAVERNAPTIRRPVPAPIPAVEPEPEPVIDEAPFAEPEPEPVAPEPEPAPKVRRRK